MKFGKRLQCSLHNKFEVYKTFSKHLVRTVICFDAGRLSTCSDHRSLLKQLVSLEVDKQLCFLYRILRKRGTLLCLQPTKWCTYQSDEDTANNLLVFVYYNSIFLRLLSIEFFIVVGFGPAVLIKTASTGGDFSTVFIWCILLQLVPDN